MIHAMGTTWVVRPGGNLVLPLTLAALVLAGRCPALADQGRRAVLDVNLGQGAMKGEVRFDLAGGPATGEIVLHDLPFGQRSPLLLADGSTTPARIDGIVRLTGTQRGGPLGAMDGTAELEATFTCAGSGCKGAVRGRGSFTGATDGLLGTLQIIAHWPEVRYDGCGAASPAEFHLALPPMGFAGLMEGRLGSRPAQPAGSRAEPREPVPQAPATTAPAPTPHAIQGTVRSSETATMPVAISPATSSPLATGTVAPEPEESRPSPASDGPGGATLIVLLVVAGLALLWWKRQPPADPGGGGPGPDDGSDIP